MYNEAGRKKSFSAHFFKIFLRKQQISAKLNAGTRAHPGVQLDIPVCPANPLIVNRLYIKENNIYNWLIINKKLFKKSTAKLFCFNFSLYFYSIIKTIHNMIKTLLTTAKQNPAQFFTGALVVTLIFAWMWFTLWFINIIAG